MEAERYHLSATDNSRLFELMLESWNKHIFSVIQHRLQSCAMKLVAAERNGEAFDSQLVIGVRESYGKSYFISYLSCSTTKVLCIYFQYLFVLILLTDWPFIGSILSRLMWNQRRSSTERKPRWFFKKMECRCT